MAMHLTHHWPLIESAQWTRKLLIVLIHHPAHLCAHTNSQGMCTPDGV